MDGSLRESALAHLAFVCGGIGAGEREVETNELERVVFELLDELWGRVVSVCHG